MSILPKNRQGLEQADDLANGTLSREDEQHLFMRRWTDPLVLARRARNAIFNVIGGRK